MHIKYMGMRSSKAQAERMHEFINLAKVGIPQPPASAIKFMRNRCVADPSHPECLRSGAFAAAGTTVDGALPAE
jgi:hypothetical protein